MKLYMYFGDIREGHLDMGRGFENAFLDMFRRTWWYHADDNHTNSHGYEGYLEWIETFPSIAQGMTRLSVALIDTRCLDSSYTYYPYRDLKTYIFFGA